MDLDNIIISFIASGLIVIRRFFLLIISPYKTLRKISYEKDYLQVIIIFILVLIYFISASTIKTNPITPLVSYLFFVINYLLTIYFFYFLASFFNRKLNLNSFIFTFAYSLFPTLIWFIINSIFYLILPPPRKISFLGSIFSIIFFSLSLSIFLWKIILSYLAVRFSTKLNFYRIIYFIFLYLCFFIPYSLLLYYFKIFRIPFI